jgi:hypothetical protein
MGSRTDLDTLEEALGTDLRESSISPQWLNTDRLHYQRRMDQDKVAELIAVMRAAPDSEKARSDMVVAIRPDRTHWLLNGQHHNEAAMRLRIPLVVIRFFLSPGYRYEKVIYDRFNRWQVSVRDSPRDGLA